MINHCITGKRRNSNLIKYSDNIMITYLYMRKTHCGISKNQPLISPKIYHDNSNIPKKKYIRKNMIYHN